MRGKPNGSNRIFTLDRITPAGAGKTYRSDDFRQCADGSPPQVRGKRSDNPYPEISATDHPRRCGENTEVTGDDADLPGSPPQVRGKPRQWCCEMFEYRITPAGAGKTFPHVLIRPVQKDHPRRCGENEKGKNCESSREGSPPQVRGKQESAKAFVRKLRITPAGAGKTRR